MGAPAQHESAKAACSATGARSYILLSNLQSGSNIGSICRNALAFGVSEVIVIGRKDFKVVMSIIPTRSHHIIISYSMVNISTFQSKMRGSDRGAKLRQKFSQFPSTSEALDHLKTLEPHGLQILGVEITKDSRSVANYQYKGQSKQASLID